MVYHVTFDRWPLHFALAWILTRDKGITQRAGVKDYLPSHPRDGWTSSDRPTEAWKLLYAKLCSGEIPAWSHATQSLADVAVNRIEPADIVGKQWVTSKENAPYLQERRFDGKTRYLGSKIDPIFVSSKGLLYYFPAGDPSVEVCSDQLGPPHSMEGPGYIGLTDAAYWIASDQGKTRIILSRPESWKDTFEKLLAHIASGNIKIIGREKGVGSPVEIEGIAFSGIAVDYPYADLSLELMLGTLPYLSCSVALQPIEDWVGGFNEKLFSTGRNSRHEPTYSHLQVLKSDVLQHFAPTPQAVTDVTPRKKGGGKQDDLADAFGKVFGNELVPARAKLSYDALYAKVIAAAENVKTASRNTFLKAEEAHNERVKALKKRA